MSVSNLTAVSSPQSNLTVGKCVDPFFSISDAVSLTWPLQTNRSVSYEEINSEYLNGNLDFGEHPSAVLLENGCKVNGATNCTIACNDARFIFGNGTTINPDAMNTFYNA